MGLQRVRRGLVTEQQQHKLMHTYGQMTADEDVKTVQWGKDSLSTNDAGKTGHSHAKQ